MVRNTKELRIGDIVRSDFLPEDHPWRTEVVLEVRPTKVCTMSVSARGIPARAEYHAAEYASDNRVVIGHIDLYSLVWQCMEKSQTRYQTVRFTKVTGPTWHFLKETRTWWWPFWKIEREYGLPVLYEHRSGLGFVRTDC